MAVAVVLADALADRAGGVEGACARHGARLRPWVEAVQRAARRSVHLSTPADRAQPLARGAVLRPSARPSLAPGSQEAAERGGRAPVA